MRSSALPEDHPDTETRAERNPERGARSHLDANGGALFCAIGHGNVDAHYHAVAGRVGGSGAVLPDARPVLRWQ